MNPSRFPRGHIRRLAGVLAAIVASALVFVLILRATPAGTALVNRVLAGLASGSGSTLVVREVRGNWMTHLDLFDLRLARDDTVLAAVDTLRVRARPWSLLRGRIDLASVDVAGLRLSRDLTRSSGGGAPGGYHGPAVRVTRLSVRDGTYGPLAGSSVTHISLDASDLRLSDETAVSLDRLAMRYGPAAPDTVVTDLWLSGTLTSAGLDVDSLRLRGPHSDVSGRAAIAFGDRTADREMSIDLRAGPLELADLEMVPGVPRMEGRVVADVSLHGAGMKGMGGTVRVEWDRADLGVVRLGVSQITATLTDGRADVEAHTDYDGARAAIRGWMRPFATAPDYDFQVDVDGLPRVVRRAAPPARARLHVAGRGLGPNEVRVDGTVTGGASRVELAGRLARGRDAPRESEWELERLVFDHVDASAWVDGAPVTDLTGVFQARGRGVSPPALHAAATWRLDASRIGGAGIASASGRAALDGAHAGTSLRVATDAGLVVVDTVVVTMDRTRGSADGTIIMARSTIRGRTLEGGRVRFQVRGGAVDVSAALTTDAGSAQFNAALAPARREVVVTDGRFADVDAARWVSGLPPTRLSGSFSGRTTTGAEPTGSAALRIDPARVGERTTLGGDVTATLDAGHLVANAAIEVGNERVTADADAQLGAGRPRGWVRGAVPFTLLCALAERDSLPCAGALNVEALFGPAAEGVHVRVAGAGRLGGCAVDSVLASLRIEDGVALVDTLRVRSDAANIDAAGRIADGHPASASNLDATIRVENPAALVALIDAGGKHSALERSLLRAQGADVRLTLRGDTLAADLDARLDEGHQAEFSVLAARDADAVGLFITDAHMQAGSARWQLAHPARLWIARDRLDVDSLEVREVSTSRKANGTNGTAAGRVYVRGTIDRRGEQDFQVDAVGVGLDVVAGGLGWEAIEGRLDASFSLRGPADAPRAEGTVRIAPVVAGTPTGVTHADVEWDGRVVDLRAALTSQQGDSLKVSGRYPMVLPLAASGTADAPHPSGAPAGEMGLRIDARRFPLAAVEPMLPPRYAAGMRGSLDADIRFSGSGTPSGSGRLAVTDGAVDLPLLGVRFENVQFEGILDGDRLTLRRVTLHSNDGELSVGGSLRVAGATRVEPDLTVTARQFTFVDLPNLRWIGSGEVTLAGALNAPVVRGRLTMGGCTYYLPPDVLGSMQTEPEITLTEADRRMLEEKFGYEVRGNRNRDTAREMFERSDLDLQVSLGRDNWLRKRSAPRLALELTGDVRARKTPGGELELTGRVAPLQRRGYIEYFGRTFDFVGGQVLLNGHMEDHTVDARAEYKVRPPRGVDEPEVVVTLAVRGHIDDLSLSLTSQPSLTESEIISYITTGRSPLNTQPSPDSRGNEALALAADIGLSHVTGALEDVAQERIGLDVLQVRYDALLGATLMAGRYMTPRLYLGFQQPLQYRETSSTSTQHPYQTAVELEFELNRWLVVNLQGEVSLLRSYLRARHEY